MTVGLPTAGTVVAVVPSVRTEPSAWLGGWAPGVGLVPARPDGAGRLALRDQIAAGARPVSPKDPILGPLPELVDRLGVAFDRLAPAERYLAGVARVLAAGWPIIALAQPGLSLGTARTLDLVASLVEQGRGIVVLERQLRLVEALGAPVWLVDRSHCLGPRRAAGLLGDEAALRLCFGGTLATVAMTTSGGAGTDAAAIGEG